MKDHVNKITSSIFLNRDGSFYNGYLGNFGSEIVHCWFAEKRESSCCHRDYLFAPLIVLETEKGRG
jgi:hypothetical protein